MKLYVYLYHHTCISLSVSLTNLLERSSLISSMRSLTLISCSAFSRAMRVGLRRELRETKSSIKASEGRGLKQGWALSPELFPMLLWKAISNKSVGLLFWLQWLLLLWDWDWLCVWDRRLLLSSAVSSRVLSWVSAERRLQRRVRRGMRHHYRTVTIECTIGLV